MTKYEKALELKKANDFNMRSCWVCNPAHEHMKESGGLRVCFDCGRWFFQGGFLDDDTHAQSEYNPDFPPAQVMVMSLTFEKENKANDKSNG